MPLGPVARSAAGSLAGLVARPGSVQDARTMLEHYRAIFTRATAAFSLTGLVARLPISMVGLGIVLLAEHETGSYAFAGAVSAVALLFNAVFAIVQGRLLDRFGQGGCCRW